MTRYRPGMRWAIAMLLSAAALPPALGQKPAPAAQAAQAAKQPAFAPLTVRHKLGTTVIRKLPVRVAALDMNEVDFLDQLGVPVAGMPKDFVPDFLAKYKDAPDVKGEPLQRVERDGANDTV